MSEVKIMLGTIFSELENGQTYYARVYTVNPEGYMQSEIGTQIGSATPQDFPAEPTSYTLIGTYTASQAWTAPEDGWFKIEIHGASGSGAAGKPAGSGWYSSTDEDSGDKTWYYYAGPSGGGGAYVCSDVKLRKGDTVVLACGAVGADTTATVASGMGVYETMKAVSGTSATTGTSNYGYAGSGGVASGGTVSNINGSNGLSGVRSEGYEYSNQVTVAARAGGAPGHVDGNKGGYGGYATSGTKYGATSGKAGFIKISRGNTNVVA